MKWFLLQLKFYYLWLEEFLFDEHAGQDERIEEILVTPGMKEALVCLVVSNLLARRLAAPYRASFTPSALPLLEILIKMEKICSEGGEPVCEFGFDDEQHLARLIYMYQQFESVKLWEF